MQGQLTTRDRRRLQLDRRLIAGTNHIHGTHVVTLLRGIPVRTARGIRAR